MMKMTRWMRIERGAQEIAVEDGGAMTEGLLSRAVVGAK